MSRNSVNLDLACRFLSYMQAYVPPISVQQRPASPSNITVTVTLSSISYFKGSNTNVTLPWVLMDWCSSCEMCSQTSLNQFTPMDDANGLKRVKVLHKVTGGDKTAPAETQRRPPQTRSQVRQFWGRTFFLGGGSCLRCYAYQSSNLNFL